MNKVISTANGGFPLTLDDIRWNDEAYRYAFNNMLKAFTTSNDKFIISGVVATHQVSPEGYNVSAGLIYYNGEILQVDAHFVSISANPLASYIIRKVTTYDPAGNVVFEDTTSHDTWQKNRGVGIHAVMALGEMSLFASRLEDLIYQNIAGRETNWLTPVFENGWGNQIGYLTNYKKDAFGWVHLRGYVKNTVANTDPIFTLPVGYRPTQFIHFVGLKQNGVVISGLIDTLGGVYPYDSNSELTLDGISFKID
jgi:hypothetical protein